MKYDTKYDTKFMTGCDLSTFFFDPEEPTPGVFLKEILTKKRQ